MFFSQNPFITSAEVYNDEDFFDREQVLHAVDKFIKRRNDYNFLIFGQRRIGKTSTLKRIHKIYNKAPNIVLYYNLQGDAETTLPVLLSKIKTLINSNIQTNYEETEEVNENEFLNSFLPDLKNNLLQKQLILLFDEFDVLGERENITALKQTYSFHKFVDFIPNIIEKIKDYEVPLKLIFAIGRNYKDLDNERFGQVTKFGQQVEVTFFSKQVVFELLNQNKNGISFTTEAKEKLWQLSGGQPYFTQCLASYSYETAEDDGINFITAEIVENSFLPTVKRYSSGVLWIWDTLIAVDKIILFLIAELTDNNVIVTNFSIKKIAENKQLLPATKKLNETLTRLVNIKFLQEINTGQYVFKSDFFRKWVNTQINLHDIQKYFSNFDTEIKNLLTNARFYFNEEQNYSEALKYYEQILKFDSSNSDAQFYAAKCYVLKPFKKNEDYEKAFNLFLKSFNPSEINRNDFIKEFLVDFYKINDEKTIKNIQISEFYKKIVSKHEFKTSVFNNNFNFSILKKLPKQKPDFEWDYKNNLQIKYKTNHQNTKELFAQIILLFKDDFAINNLVWSEGIIAEKDNTFAQVLILKNSNEIFLRVFGENKKNILLLIDNKIIAILHSLPNYFFEKLIPCNCIICSEAKNPNFYDFSDLKRRISKGKETVECRISYDDVNVRNLLKNYSDFI